MPGRLTKIADAYRLGGIEDAKQAAEEVFRIPKVEDWVHRIIEGSVELQDRVNALEVENREYSEIQAELRLENIAAREEADAANVAAERLQRELGEQRAESARLMSERDAFRGRLQGRIQDLGVELSHHLGEAERRVLDHGVVEGCPLCEAAADHILETIKASQE